MSTNDSITISTPDDWHCHLREGSLMQTVAPISGEIFARVVAMPNLAEPITSPALARNYKQQLITAYPHFEPLIPCYLQEQSKPQTILAGYESGDFFSVKYYPRGATTNSKAGVYDWQACSAVFSAMEEADIPLMIHGEVTAPEVDIFDREQRFLDDVLVPILKKHKKLRIVLEHITTRDAVNFIQYADHQIAATITAHHLVLTRTDLLANGLHPHHFCYPIVKTQTDVNALRKAATSANPRFMLGTDSAPHANNYKHQNQGKAGIFSSPTALAIYTQIFAEENALHHLNHFASLHGCQFHHLSTPPTTVSLTRSEVPQPVQTIVYPPTTTQKTVTHETLSVFLPPEGLFWSISQNTKKELQTS